MSTGHSSAMTFATTGITLPIVSIDPPEEAVEDIAAPHLGLSVGDNIPYDPSELVEGGEYTVELANDLDTSIAPGTKETITWTKPVASGNTVAATWAFTGYIKSVKEAIYKTAERNIISIVVKVASNVTKTAGS